MVSEAGAFVVDGEEVHSIRYAVGITVDRCLPEARLVRGSHQSHTIRGYVSCGDKPMSRNIMERGA